MPLTAVRHVRKMRGGAQSHLLQADDGRWYVVKFRNNPQHRRILVNELLCSIFLSYLKIAVPEPALIHITPEFLAENPQLHLNLGARAIPIEPGWHFGSQFPGDPNQVAVYDYLPDALLAQVANLDDFRAILVFDKWVANADGRQSIFHRALVRRSEERAPASRQSFVATMIDHGFAFNGPHWDFPESPLQGIYHRRVVYESVRSLDDFRPWLDLVVHFPEEIIDRAWKRVPRGWIDGEEDQLAQLLDRLHARRARLPELISACRDARSSPFANWPGSSPR